VNYDEPFRELSRCRRRRLSPGSVPSIAAPVASAPARNPICGRPIWNWPSAILQIHHQAAKNKTARRPTNGAVLSGRRRGASPVLGAFAPTRSPLSPPARRVVKQKVKAVHLIGATIRLARPNTCCCCCRWPAWPGVSFAAVQIEKIFSTFASAKWVYFADDRWQRRRLLRRLPNSSIDVAGAARWKSVSLVFCSPSWGRPKMMDNAGRCSPRRHCLAAQTKNNARQIGSNPGPRPRRSAGRFFLALAS
jgi:hypothetical protein